MAAHASRFAALPAEWDRASAKTDPPARTGDVGRRPIARTPDRNTSRTNAPGGRRPSRSGIHEMLPRPPPRLVEAAISTAAPLSPASCDNVIGRTPALSYPAALGDRGELDRIARRLLARGLVERPAKTRDGIGDVLRRVLRHDLHAKSRGAFRHGGIFDEIGQ